eukprot:1155653-Rhodomonas_salina.1
MLWIRAMLKRGMPSEQREGGAQNNQTVLGETTRTSKKSREETRKEDGKRTSGESRSTYRSSPSTRRLVTASAAPSADIVFLLLLFFSATICRVHHPSASCEAQHVKDQRLEHAPSHRVDGWEERSALLKGKGDGEVSCRLRRETGMRQLK